MTLLNAIPEYNFHKTKYGAELLIDIVALKGIKKYLPQKLLHRLTYYDITFITEGEGHFSINEQEYPLCRWSPRSRDGSRSTAPRPYRRTGGEGLLHAFCSTAISSSFPKRLPANRKPVAASDQGSLTATGVVTRRFSLS